jgi:hypothetical protein
VVFPDFQPMIVSEEPVFHLSLSTKSSFYHPAFEISHSFRTASAQQKEILCSCQVQHIDLTKCIKLQLPINANIQFTLNKALHFSEEPKKNLKIFYITVIKTSLCFGQWMECEQN